MGDADLRELLDVGAIAETEEALQCLVEPYKARAMDGVHDLLLRIGDLSRAELLARCISPEIALMAERLRKSRRSIEVLIAGEKRLVASEDAARFRDALGVALPAGLPEALLEPRRDAGVDLIRRYARTHGPFTTQEAAARFGLGLDAVEATLHRLVQSGRVVEGGFRPGGQHREWCDVEVLRTVRRKSLARLRKEVEPVPQATLARLITRWQGVVQPRRGLDALLDVIENLQGAAIPASLLETEILPARILNYQLADLDTLIAAGEVVWCGLDAIGERDGRIGLYLAERLPSLWPAGAKSLAATDSEERIVAYLRSNGASFFPQIHEALGGGFPGETIDALWSLVWRGQVTNDALHALRAYTQPPSSAKPARKVHNTQASFRSRRTTPPAAQGRWALNDAAFAQSESSTKYAHAMAQQLLVRYGVVFRETAHAESLPGGFSAIYDVLKALEESGRIRRGYFAAGLGATQFALPAAVELLRSLRTAPQPDKPEMLFLAATDPANPYGALLRWPAVAESSLSRSVGARVILADGELIAYLRRGNPNVQVFMPEDEPMRSRRARQLAEFLVESAQRDPETHAGMLISTINGASVAQHWLARTLLDAGFHAAPKGFNIRRVAPGSGVLPH